MLVWNFSGIGRQGDRVKIRRHKIVPEAAAPFPGFYPGADHLYGILDAGGFCPGGNRQLRAGIFAPFLKEIYHVFREKAGAGLQCPRG